MVLDSLLYPLRLNADIPLCGGGAVVGALSAVDENNRKHSDSADTNAGEDKDASVVGRAVVGGIIAGPAGAVVGAASAVDKNNRKHNKKDKK